MVDSYKKSVHVQSFVEADVTELWNWYSKNKDEFLNTYNTKLTLTPIFHISRDKSIIGFSYFK